MRRKSSKTDNAIGATHSREQRRTVLSADGTVLCEIYLPYPEQVDEVSARVIAEVHRGHRLGRVKGDHGGEDTD